MKNVFALTAVAASLFLSVSGCSPQKEVYNNAFFNLPEGARYEYEPGYARYVDPDVLVEAAYLSPEGLDVYFSRFKDGIYKNPFPPHSFMVFSLTVENRGVKSVTFNPRMTILVTEKQGPVAPTDYSELYSDLMLVEAEGVDGRMDSFKATAYDTTETLGPGESVQRLIAFTRSEKAGGDGTFMFNGLYVGHKSRSVTLRYAEDISLPEGYAPQK